MSKRLNHKNAFKRAYSVLSDKRLSNKLVKEAKETLTSRAKASEKIGQLKNKIATLVRLVKAYTKGSYRNISFKSMIYTVGVLIYFITPMDILPDFIPVSGFLDDASLILWLYNHLGHELQQFKAWESKQEESEIMLEINTSIKAEAFDKAIDYPTYRNLIKSLLAENKTTGTNHSEAMINYTIMNDKRMDRWDKKIVLDTDLINSIKELPKMNWLVITEAWCGDAAQNIPFLAKLAQENPNIDLKFIMRDENSEIMDAYLTNGSRSIPILILMDQDFNDIANWGPRPKPVQEMVMDAKKKPDLDQKAFIESIHKWYAVDKNQTITQEFKELIKTIQ